MPEITLRNITKRWGKFFGVDHLDLDIADNSFITLLGPSGCGKNNDPPHDRGARDTDDWSDQDRR